MLTNKSTHTHTHTHSHTHTHTHTPKDAATCKRQYKFKISPILEYIKTIYNHKIYSKIDKI